MWQPGKWWGWHTWASKHHARKFIPQLRYYFMQESNKNSPLSAIDICPDFIHLQSFAGYTLCISQNHQLLGTIYVFDMTTYIKLKLFLHKCIQYIECIYLLTVTFVPEYTEVCLLLSKQSFVNFNVVCHSFHTLKLFKWNFTELGQPFNWDKAF